MWVGARRAAVLAAAVSKGHPANHPLIIGVTGSIGMGKSAVTAHFRRLGFAVHDADEAVHDMYKAGGAAVDPLKAEFDGVVDESGAVCRDALSAILKKEPTRINDLNRIVHPLVAQHRDCFLEEHKNDFLCVLDVPLLFETNGENLCDVVVVVSTGDKNVQKERVLSRNRMTEEKFEMIISKQMPDAEKRKKADFIVDTRRACLTAMRYQVADLIESLANEFSNEFKTKVLEKFPTNESNQGLVALALDLDDTVWDFLGWAADLPKAAEEFYKELIPNAYENGIRYSDSESLATIKSLRAEDELLAHDFTEMRRQLFVALAKKYGDDVNKAEELTERYVAARSQTAFNHIYPFAIPFLEAARNKGLLIASITDGNGDISKSEVLDKLFDINCSSRSAGKPKPHQAQFLEALARIREVHPQTNASQVMVIGDNLDKDIAGANGVGMPSAWIRVKDDFEDPNGISIKATRVTSLDRSIFDTSARI